MPCWRFRVCSSCCILGKIKEGVERPEYVEPVKPTPAAKPTSEKENYKQRSQKKVPVSVQVLRPKAHLDIKELELHRNLQRTVSFYYVASETAQMESKALFRRPVLYVNSLLLGLFPISFKLDGFYCLI